ncbi:hypothetical protein ACFFKU_11675 [Kineococcus gynurae]|uniref:Uncharacterized protein n=1 Tax=Kineococcus gynurae TaxID=452979 RepID=A0ABV5LR65_9ACTN
MFSITIRPSRLLAVLLSIAAILALLSVSFLVATAGLGIDSGIVVSARKFVDLDTEQNLPSWYSSMLLCVTGLSTLEVGRRAVVEKLRYRWHWFVLGLGFLYLSLDELVGLHEKLAEPMAGLVGTSGILRYSWIAAAAPLAVMLVIAYLGFLRAQPGRILRLMLLGGGLYLGGAIVVEALGGYLISAGSDELGVGVGLVATVEEFFEMSGPAVFLVAVALVQQNFATLGPGRHAVRPNPVQSSTPRAANA